MLAVLKTVDALFGAIAGNELAFRGGVPGYDALARRTEARRRAPLGRGVGRKVRTTHRDRCALRELKLSRNRPTPRREVLDAFEG
jgi:hypothetical protein